MIGRYQTAKAFRAALEDRLKQLARMQRIDLMRLRRQVAFDRLLARLFAMPDTPWVLKGGYTFEIRLGSKARVTKDLDLSIPDLRRLIEYQAGSDMTGEDAAGDGPARETSAIILDALREATAVALADGFEFRIGAPMTDLDAAPYGGARYPVEARLDARTFATFHLDVGVGDAVSAVEWLTGPDLLGFAEIPPAYVAALCREQQFAEKLHAYTLPRGDRTNTRVKDLVDLVLLLRIGLPETEAVKHALRATFARRMTHPLPTTLAPPPAEWRAAFDQMATEADLTGMSLDAAFDALVAYWRILTL